MPTTTLQTNQMANEAALPSLGKAARTTLDQTFAGIEKNLDLPLRASAAQTPDASLYFTANKITRADGTALTTPPISSTIPSVTSGSIDFQAGTTSGGNFDITFPASTVGYFRRVGFTLFADGVVSAIFSPEVATFGSLANPGTVFTKGLPICFIDLECTNITGRFKTAGSATNIIENSVGGTSRIVMFGSGGGGGASVAVYPTVQSIAAGGEFTTDVLNSFQVIRCEGDTQARTASATPFGATGGWIDGTLVETIGSDDTKTVTITYNDAAKGCVGNFSSIELAKYQTAKFRYINAIDRWVYVQ